MAITDFFKRLAGLADGPAKSAFAPTSEDIKRWDDLIQESLGVPNWFSFDFTKLPAARAILDLPDEAAKARLLLAGAGLLQDGSSVLAAIRSMNVSDSRWRIAHALKQIISALLRPELPLDAGAVSALLQLAANNDGISWIRLPYAGVIRAAERFASRQSLTSDHRHFLSGLREFLAKRNDAESRKIANRIDVLLRDPANSFSPPAIAIDPGEPWADAAIALRLALSPEWRNAWDAILAHAASARTSSPSKKWLTTAQSLIDNFGLAEYVSMLQSCLPLVGQPGPGREVMSILGTVNEPTALSPHNADLLKGIVWTAAVLTDPAIPALLGDVAEVCFKKIPNIGARCPKVANACLTALSLIPGPAAVAQITRIQSKAKKASARKIVERALTTSANSQGVSRDELEEMSIPDFGLSPGAGMRQVPVGSFTAELLVHPPARAEIRWLTPAGKTQKAIPPDIKRDHPDTVKELQRAVKDIQRILPAQAARIERLFLEDRSWPVAIWRERYLDHPLVSLLARRLIWQINSDAAPTSFLPLDGRPTDSTGNPVDLPESATISLWHPIHAGPDTVLAWRRFLFDHHITQPFKQAHREIYVLTDAERATDTYSNRFAAHILRQHQFQALCDARGWTYRLMGGFDSHNTPTRYLSNHNICIEFWVDSAGQDLTAAGIFTHIATDQVRFACGQARSEPMRLTDVPPLLFSELMRDVDLFVGVASVGNDPTWQDGGPNGRFQNYWQSVSFGDLSESAKTRRAVLETLLPRLTKLAGRWSLADRFLHIRGDRRSYKIHLGSGNILMEPNDQYLCIVPSRSPAEKSHTLFLPFEGDQTLSVILSKAFLLVADTKITDHTITRQIASR